MNKINNTILLNLSTEKYTTAAQLAEQCLVSEKTIRNYIKELSELVVEHGAFIERKHGYGYRLIISDPVKYSSLYSEKEKASEGYIPQNGEERCNFIIQHMLINYGEAEIEKLVDMLCISESTLQLDLNRIRKILDSYHLKLTVRDFNHLKIEGNEFDKRIFLVNYNSLYENGKDVSISKQEISSVLLSVLSEYNISMSEVSIQNLVLHFYTSLKRIKYHHYLEQIPSFDSLSSDEDNLSLIVSNTVCDELEKKYNTLFSKTEREALALHLFGHRVTEKFGVGKSNVVISQSIYDDVLDILQFIYITLGVDQRKNLALLMNLAIHMVSLDVRIKYNIHLKNPLLMDIKKNYSLGYTLALQAKNCIERKYAKKLNDDEVGYLALIFEISLKTEKKPVKKNILIVCATGKTSAELLAYQYREVFGNYLNKINICNINELAKQDFSNIDYILTTTIIQISVPVPILAVKMMLTDEDENILKEMFKQNGKNRVMEYYPEELFFTNLEADNKKEAIYKLCELVSKKRKLPEGYADSIIERENYGATDFGEMVALAHPYQLFTEETFASVGILKQPVFWGNHDIQIIILISVSEGVHDELTEFYRCTSAFMLDRSSAKKLLKNPEYVCFRELISEK